MSEIDILTQLESASAFLVTVFILYRLFLKQCEQIERLIDVIVKRENCEDPSDSALPQKS